MNTLLSALLKARPAKQTFDPPADLPLDRTAGGAPPYDFPPELIRELAGKSEAQVSSLLSKFRTGLSEHRTHLSEHRTDLSEHRTDLSDYRTELSGHRTDLSEHRTALSDARSHLSNERTHLSYLRTAVSLMSFGVTLNRFAVFLIQSDRLTQDVIEGSRVLRHMRSAEEIGAGMVVLGIGLLVWSLYRYRQVHRQIERAQFESPHLSVTVMTLLIVAGAATALAMIWG